MTDQTDPISVAAQIQYLSAHGMNFSDIERAKRTLNHIGFHRLSSYWQPFKLPPGNGSEALFKEGTYFNAVVTRYLFDQRLRSLLLEAFSFIEISVRTHWAYQLAHGLPISTGSSLTRKKRCSTRSTTKRTSWNSGGLTSRLAI